MTWLDQCFDLNGANDPFHIGISHKSRDWFAQEMRDSWHSHLRNSGSRIHIIDVEKGGWLDGQYIAIAIVRTEKAKSSKLPPKILPAKKNCLRNWKSQNKKCDIPNQNTEKTPHTHTHTDTLDDGWRIIIWTHKQTLQLLIIVRPSRLWFAGNSLPLFPDPTSGHPHRQCGTTAPSKFFLKPLEFP